MNQKILKSHDKGSLVQFGVLASSVVVLLIIGVYPFCVLLSKILFSGTDGAFSIEPFRDIFQSDATLVALKNTLAVSTSVSLASTLIGIPFAWLLTRTDFPLRDKIKSWLSLPYAIPPYIGAIAWIFLANPTTGLLNHVVGNSFINIYSFWGLVWVETSFLYTFILLTTSASLERMDSSFEEAARLSGASSKRVFVDVTLPLIKPTILSGALLVFLATSASFGVPALIGSPGGIYLLTTQIYTYQKVGSMGGLYKAGALSMLLLLVAAITLFLNHLILKRSNFQTVSGKTARASVVELGAKKPLFFFLAILFLIIAFVTPMGGILLSSLSQTQGDLDLSNFSLSNFFRVIFETEETARAFFNSITLGITAATAACFLGMILSYIRHKTQLRGRGLIEILAALPYSVPGTVLALSLILAFSGNFLGIGSLYNTLGMLWLAYLTKYLSFATKTTGDGYQQIDNVLSEAARVSGASWLTTMRTIWFPLMKTSLVAAWFLIFMPVVSELTMTILLTGPGLETIGTLIFQLQEYADASGGSASVLAVLIIALVIIINSVVKRLSQGKYGL